MQVNVMSCEVWKHDYVCSLIEFPCGDTVRYSSTQNTFSFLHCVCGVFVCVLGGRPWSCLNDSVGTIGSMTTATLDVCVFVRDITGSCRENRVKCQKGNCICCCCSLSRLPIKLLALTLCPLCSDSTQMDNYFIACSPVFSLSLCLLKSQQTITSFCQEITASENGILIPLCIVWSHYSPKATFIKMIYDHIYWHYCSMNE